MAEEFEHLLDFGDFGLTCGIEYSILEIDYGDGYRDSSLIGSSLGTRSWSYVYKTLPGTMDYPIQVDEATFQPQADYIWDFWCRRMAEGSGDFTLTCPRDGKRYLGYFVEHKLRFELFAARLFSTGLLIRQSRRSDVSVLADGSLGDFGIPENPSQI